MLMNKADNLTEKGKAAGASLRKASKQEERKIEAQKGSELRKGEMFRGAVEELRRQERRIKTTLSARRKRQTFPIDWRARNCVLSELSFWAGLRNSEEDVRGKCAAGQARQLCSMSM
jgi:hypothetical protein